MHYSPRIWPKSKGPSWLVFSSLSPRPSSPPLPYAASPASPPTTAGTQSTETHPAWRDFTFS